MSKLKSKLNKIEVQSIGSGVEGAILSVTSHRYEAKLSKQFSLLSLLGLGFSILSSWIGLSSGLGVNLTDGGSASLIYGLIIGWIAILVITLGMSELASTYITAAGQYHWVYIVSSRKMRSFAAFFTGWINVFGWWMAISSLALFCSTCITAIAKLWHPNYDIEKWHSYLCYVGIILIVVFLNAGTPKILPKLNVVSLYLSVTSFLVSLMVILVMARDHYNTAEFVFTDHENLSGWSNSGIVFLLGIGNAMYPFVGTDAPAHLSEELPEPERNVPKAMIGSLSIGLLTGLPFAIVLMFVMRDKLIVVNTATGLPFLELIYQATQSKSAATGVVALVLSCFLLTTAGALTAGSRLVWAFSRDNGLPWSSKFSKLDKNGAPSAAVLISAIFVTAWGTIYIGSETAFNSFLSAAVTFQGYAYVIPQGILVWRGREKVLPKKRQFNLGAFGAAINTLACLWMIFISIVFCFPPEMPVSVQTMNYISVPLVGVPLLICLYWVLVKKKRFEGPEIYCTETEDNIS